MTRSLQKRFGLLTLTIAFLLAFCWITPANGKGDKEDRGDANPAVFAPNSHPYGTSYSEWVAAFFQWALPLPVDGHPFIVDAPNFDFGAHQSGRVWFWSAPEETFTRNATMPEGTAIFLTTLDAECSSLEDAPFFGATEQEQRDGAEFFVDRIHGVFVIIDGVRVKNVDDYRFSSPQFKFNAPTPWVFGATGGAGTSVGDGYFFMLKPLKAGKHTIRYGGAFHFEAGVFGPDPVDITKDVTIHLTVVPRGGKGHHDD